MAKAKILAVLVFIFCTFLAIDSVRAAEGRGGGGGHGGRSVHGGQRGEHGHRWGGGQRGDHGTRWHGGSRGEHGRRWYGGHRGGHGHRWHGGHHYRGSRWSYGIYLGAPWVPYFPEPYFDPAYHYPPTAVGPAYSPDYIERGDVQESPAPATWWYYCAEVDAYYPYVRECPGGWVQVAPQPPSS